MKRVKQPANSSAKRVLFIESDSESSVSSISSKDSNKSLGKWSKRSKKEVGPVVVSRKGVAPPARHKNYKVVTPTLLTTNTQKSNYFDLSQEIKEHTLLPGKSYNALKARHELFFTYDPRGSKDFDGRYCQYCKCPKSYCNEVVFGKTVKRQTKFFIEEFGGLMKDEVTGDSVWYNYQKIYSEQIHHKMLTNGIRVPSGYDFYTLIAIPACVFDGSLKELFDDCAKTKVMRFELGNPWENLKQKNTTAKLSKNSSDYDNV
jgi:hypothetical protein